jgi:hypothetical protein
VSTDFNGDKTVEANVISISSRFRSAPELRRHPAAPRNAG